MEKNSAETLRANAARSGAASQAAIESQYVTFELAEETYGVNVGDAIEVIRLVAMAEPPEAPPYVIGLINIRGQVVPVVDMRRRLSLESADYTLTTPILIARVQSWTVGLIVDKVKEVIMLPTAMIEPPSGAFSKSRYVAGVAKIDAELIFLLDLAGLFSNNDARLLEGLFAPGRVEENALV